MRWRCDPDYESARNLSQRLVQIARATEDGIVTSKEVAQHLIFHGQSRAEYHNLRGNVNGALRAHEDFDPIGKGTFQYRFFSLEDEGKEVSDDIGSQG